MLVDDNPSVLNSLDIQLKSAGFSTLAIQSLNEAREKSLRKSNVFALLITDIILGDRTGFCVAKDFVKLNPSAKIIYISGHPSSEFQRDIRELSGPFLTKPFRMLELHSKVTKVLSSQVA